MAMAPALGRRVLFGGASGLAATAPMTLAMWLLQRRLPVLLQYRLPPRQVTQELTEKVGIWQRLKPWQRTALTAAMHFGYGAVAGAAYAAGKPGRVLPRLVSGPLFGLAVWAGSYLGWLPALDVRRPATQEPAPRNRLMIAAHLVWGGAMGLLMDLASWRERRAADRLKPRDWVI
jgi:hypothetical protein